MSAATGVPPSGGPLMSRRRFLGGVGAVGAAGAAAALVKASPWSSGAGDAHASKGGGAAGPLVLVTLYGGNDGLNTVVPYHDPSYSSSRPTLGYAADQVLPLDDSLALNPNLRGLHSLWGQGSLAIVRGVGYPNPSLSHFESMDIWQTANPADGTGTGWLGRWLDATGDDPMRAISVGITLPPALRGATQSATAINSARIVLPGGEAVDTAFADLLRRGADRSGLAASVMGVSSDLLLARSKLESLNVDSGTGAVSGSLSSQMELVAALIKAGADTRVYQVSLSSFDTHADEKANHERLLSELDAAIGAFFGALKGSPHGSGVVVMTYSEFGRRLAQNASGGTDHGTAAPLFVAGPAVRGGRFYGEEPSLTRLDPNGNLVFTTDFRSVYATMLERVVGVDPEPILGGSFPVIDLV